MYLAIDPGAHPGWAILSDELRLIGCGINLAPRWKFKAVLCERPTVYPRSRVPPADIVTLAISAGELVLPFRELGSQILWVQPRTWKGQIPKAPHHASIMDALAPSERAVVAEDLKGVAKEWQEDAKDAVGLAAYGRRFRLFR